MNDQMSKLLADADAPVKASNDEMKEIGRLVRKAINLEEEMAAMQAQLKLLMGEYTQIVEKDIPAIMDEAGTSLFQDSVSGKKVIIKDDVHASISKDNTEVAHKWLRDHNHDDIIKNVITANFSKGQDNLAGDVLGLLRDKYGLDAERRESVHASTLKAFCKEQLAAGVDLPAGPFGLFIRRVAVIK